MNSQPISFPKPHIGISGNEEKGKSLRGGGFAHPFGMHRRACTSLLMFLREEGEKGERGGEGCLCQGDQDPWTSSCPPPDQDSARRHR